MSDTLSQYDRIQAQLKTDEAVRLKPYLDCCGKYWRLCTCAVKGKLTIGIGRNLDDVGISDIESNYLNKNDINKATVTLISHLPWVKSLDEVRAAVLIEMTFNMGIGELGKSGLLAFTATLSLIQSGQYADAGKEMLASRWATQVGARAQRLAKQMQTGAW